MRSVATWHRCKISLDNYCYKILIIILILLPFHCVVINIRRKRTRKTYTGSSTPFVKYLIVM